MFDLLVLFHPSCKNRTGSKLDAINKDTERLKMLDPEYIGPDLPPFGRSLFDHLITVKEGGKEYLKIPSSIGELRNLIRSRGTYSQVSTFFFPFSRSAQRFAAHPQYLKFPRVVMIAHPHSEPSPGGDMLLGNKLFVGFSPATFEAEIISYNEGLGRYEFQIIDDLRPEGNPKVYYVNRIKCLTCHQGGAAILSKFNWPDFHLQNEEARKIFSDALDPKLLEEFSDVVTVQKFGTEIDLDIPDSAVRSSNMASLVQRAWVYGCGTDKEGDHCRAEIMKRSLAVYFGRPVEDVFTDRLREQIARNLNHQLTFYTSFLTDAPSVDELIPNFHNRLNLVKNELKKLDGTKDDPKLPRKVTIELDQSLIGMIEINNLFVEIEVFPYLLLDHMGNNKKGASGDLEVISTSISSNGNLKLDRLNSAIDGMLQNPNSDAFAAKPLRRGVFMTELLKELELDGSTFVKNYEHELDFSPPKLKVLPGLTFGEIQDPSLQLFYRYCRECHQDPGSDLDFLTAETEEQAWDKIRERKDAILHYLSSKEDPMPPISTASYKALHQPNQGRAQRNDLQIMLDALN